jgi:hypothetical protein
MNVPLALRIFILLSIFFFLGGSVHSCGHYGKPGCKQRAEATKPESGSLGKMRRNN